MNCYLLAKNIMERIRTQSGYVEEATRMFYGVEYYDGSIGGENFILRYKDVALRIFNGKMRAVVIDYPRGIVLFNLRLWLMEIDRLTSRHVK